MLPILFLCHSNAAALFRHKVVLVHRHNHPHDKVGYLKTRGASDILAPRHIAQPKVDETLDLREFPKQLKQLAEDVSTFLNCLNEFPEFTDEAVNATIRSFEGDLQYWSSCLKDHTELIYTSSTRRYLHDLSMEMGNHIEAFGSALSVFVEIGVPTIRFAQQHGATHLVNLSTIAIFFSAVTATTLQFSFSLPRNTVPDAVNCFWFASLVFSVSAAVNSLVGLTWKQAMYRSPFHHVPWWILVWIKRSPLVFLIVSAACFSVGLCCFAYASNQAPLTSILTAAFTAFTSSGLVIVSVWFSLERYIFFRHRGEKWLRDALSDGRTTFMGIPGVHQTKTLLYTIGGVLGGWSNALQILCRKVLRSFSAHLCKGRDIEAGLPTTHLNNAPVVSNDISMKSLVSPHSPSSLIEISSGLGTDVQPTLGKQMWARTIRSVQTSLAFQVAPSNHRSPIKKTTTDATEFVDRNKAILREEDQYKAVLRRVAHLRPVLKLLQPCQEVAAHQALVRHLQFSPDGKYLATSSWDRTSVVFSVEVRFPYGETSTLGPPPVWTPQDPLTAHHILPHDWQGSCNLADKAYL
ncbi:hypothetical protein DXG01_005872 [Tephrocybe rancida]|nr:hypothetical protein DXG01_005872 [Tephrocybe rancida]